MYALLTICLTGLFSAWVYALKQEVEYLRRRLEGTRRKDAHQHAERASELSHTAVKFDSAVKSETVGIPTWTIK